MAVEQDLRRREQGVEYAARTHNARDWSGIANAFGRNGDDLAGSDRTFAQGGAVKETGRSLLCDGLGDGFSLRTRLLSKSATYRFPLGSMVMAAGLLNSAARASPPSPPKPAAPIPAITTGAPP